MAAGLVVVVFMLALAGRSSATWCMCKDGLSDAVLQKTLDYACGAGADCTLIHQNGACFNPNTLRAHCSYAVNSFFQRKGQAAGSCDFAGSAAVTPSDPSTAGCVYPSSASTSTTPGTTTPTTGTPSTTTPTTGTPTTTTPTMGTPTTTTPTTGMPTNTTPIGGSPYVTTPSTGALGGTGTGLGPSGVGINTDMSDGGITLEKTSCLFSFLITLMISGLVFLWG